MLLCLDRSLPAASMALFREGACLAAMDAPTAPAVASPHPWETLLDDLLAAAGATLPDIDAFAVGLGPGSFSGIRTALAFAKGLSLPSGAPLRGFPSAAALAREHFLHAPKAERVFVVGDARRDTVWLADYRRESVGAAATETGRRVDVACLTLDEARASLSLAPEVPVLSPDAGRLAGRLDGILPCPAAGDRPLAQALGELALLAPEQAVEPPLPLYLHPAVRPRPA